MVSPPIHPEEYVSKGNFLYFVFLFAYYLKLAPLLLLIIGFRDPLTDQILFQYLRNPKGRQTVKIRGIATDLLRLAIIRQIQRGKQIDSDSFQVLAHFDSEAGQILFTSLANQEYDLSTEVTQDQQSFWLAFEAAWQEGRIKKMGWDHSAIGGALRYRLTRFISLPLRFVEGVYSFDALVKLSQMVR